MICIINYAWNVITNEWTKQHNQHQNMYLKITSKIKKIILTYLVYFLTNWSADKS